MGLLQSSMMCANEQAKCSYSTKTYDEYNTYSKTIPATDTTKQSKLQTFMCGSHEGSLTQCCDKTSVSSSNVSTTGKLINPILGSDGNIVEYQLCKCTDDTCAKTNCAGFKKATNYELCKARSVKPDDTVYVSKYIDKILAANAYPDCYSSCK